MLSPSSSLYFAQFFSIAPVVQNISLMFKYMYKLNTGKCNVVTENYHNSLFMKVKCVEWEWAFWSSSHDSEQRADSLWMTPSYSSMHMDIFISLRLGTSYRKKSL